MSGNTSLRKRRPRAPKLAPLAKINRELDELGIQAEVTIVHEKIHIERAQDYFDGIRHRAHVNLAISGLEQDFKSALHKKKRDSGIEVANAVIDFIHSPKFVAMANTLTPSSQDTLFVSSFSNLQLNSAEEPNQTSYDHQHLPEPFHFKQSPAPIPNNLKRKYNTFARDIGKVEEAARDHPNPADEEPARILGLWAMKNNTELEVAVAINPHAMRDNLQPWNGNISLLGFEFTDIHGTDSVAQANRNALNIACWWVLHGSQMMNIGSVSNTEVLVTRSRAKPKGTRTLLFKMNSWEYDDQEENIKEVATLAKTPRVQPKSQIPTKSIYQKPVVNDEKEENKENAGAATFDLPFHPRGH